MAGRGASAHYTVKQIGRARWASIRRGARDRLHRTMKRQAIKPLWQTCTAQQRNFDAFRREYNEERQHEALRQRPPASRYTV